MDPEINTKQYDPAQRYGVPVPLSVLAQEGATNGQVLVWSASAGQYIPGSAVSSALANGHIFVGNASNIATAVAMSGDATIVASGALTIANNAITTPKVLNGVVTGAKLSVGAGYFSVTVLTTGATPVNVFASAPVGLVVKGFIASGADATGAAFSVDQTAGNIGSGTTPAAGAVIGPAAALANATVAQGAALTVTGAGGGHESYVTIFFQTA